MSLNLHLCQFGIDQPFFDKVQGVVLVFNIGEPDSYEAVRRAVRQAKDEVGDELIGVIAANHGELRHTYNENLVEYKKLESLEDEFSIKVIEVSSVTNENVEELFFYVTKKMVQKMKKEKKNLEVQKRKKVIKRRSTSHITNHYCCY